jgi:hypothetical protein
VNIFGGLSCDGHAASSNNNSNNSNHGVLDVLALKNKKTCFASCAWVKSRCPMPSAGHAAAETVVKLSVYAPTEPFIV